MQCRIGFVAVLLAGFFISSAFAERAAPDGAWAERVQVLYVKDKGTVERHAVRVWDSEPEKNLDFVWEPAEDGTLAADGTVNGRGKLVWRVRGSASYDPDTIYSTYVGGLKDGRLDGQGRLQFRSGELFEGHFVAGRLEGKGLHVDMAGNRYEGGFIAGRPHGEGRLAETTGTIYTGSFANGLKHGEGTSQLAGGATYVSRWTMGLESGRPEVVADATLGGLLKAQSGGDAGKAEIAVAIEPRMTQRASDSGVMTYQHLVQDQSIAIYPIDDRINGLWNGSGQISTDSWMFDNRDWDAPAYVEVGVRTRDGSKVKLDRLELAVANSEAYRKPMLATISHQGCTGFRPSFSIKNYGWGDVRDMKMTLQFATEKDDIPRSRAFSRVVGSFDEGIDVAIKDIFDEVGVETGKLAKARYTCPSREAVDVCRSQVFNDAGFGDIADYVEGNDQIYTNLAGTLDYKWADDSGTVYDASETFRVDISLAVIEYPIEAECGDLAPMAPEALRYQEVHLPVGKKDYSIDIPVRGNRSISSYIARMKLDAEPAMSSFHQFSVAAHFTDGSIRKSKPVNLYYVQPRLSKFQPGMEPPVCTLSSVGGC
jgi:hypothetical protein